MQDDSTNLAESIFEPQPNPPPHSLTIKMPANTGLRRSTRRTSSVPSIASGSEYHASEKSMDMDEHPEEHPGEQPEDEATGEMRKSVIKTLRGRVTTRTVIVESSEGDGEGEPDEDVPVEDLFKKGSQRVTRRSKNTYSEDDEDEDGRPKRRLRRRDPFIASEDDEHDDQPRSNGGYATRNRTKKANAPPQLTAKEKEQQARQKQQADRARRLNKRNATRGPKDDDYEHISSGASADADGSIDDAAQSSDHDDLGLPEEPEPDPEPEEDADGRPYSLRERKNISYAIPPPIEELVKTSKSGNKGGRHGGGGARGKPRLGWSAGGKELGKWMGMPNNDDSDSDYNTTRTPRKPYGGLAPFGSGAVAAGGMLPGDLAAGTPSNLGKIGDAALADADPLGVNQNVTFDEVGGLDDHIHALKEMTLLPLLYPEVFQRFNVTPPRGVLFHGPPGTGKTLMARALAASCRTGGRQISFYMRKGADCLSKWVGEAERQLRLLFEEARNSQPSIIFFDEIDGLAPVRSSKQDQIHASIVSTLLALMDGMDGRGQVVVIGATNRPDAVDPALRRPGRFDREFYFGLPGLEAREKILNIMTNKWEGWGAHEDDKTEEKQKEIKEKVLGLAKLTKGYGGADLRALCTEAALNAIQRRYPQVYKSNDRLLLKPETIGVGLRDFMISIKKLVPSSARSSASAATPLPIQLTPLLQDTLEEVKTVIHRVMPVEKKLSALEEAEFEDEGGEEGALEKEMLSQAMQTLRVYRPRVVIHGPIGMGQGYIGAAALHHLEGYHVQSLELGSLLSDSTRTAEAAIVQLFIEAKRNQPSVIYIPSLVGWCAAISETARSTVRAMLDTLAPTDPILLLAVVDGSFAELPRDVKAWFGPTRDNRVQLATPGPAQRAAFFDGLLEDVQRPPNKFADGMARRKRVLEELPIAPPLEPRKPTAAELAQQAENDQRVLNLLKYRLGPILAELKRKFKRFTKRATEEYNFDPRDNAVMDTVTTTAIEVHRGANGLDVTDDQPMPLANGDHVPSLNGNMMEQQQAMQRPPLFDMDLERIQSELFKGRYITPNDFLDDVGKIVHNAQVRADEDQDRLSKAMAMFTACQVSIDEFDKELTAECARVAPRERQRREEWRKEKEKQRGKDQGENPSAPSGARRSARTNGLEPEHAITDPDKLMRRLKRQRGEDGSGLDSNNASELEAAHGFSLPNGERETKRHKVVDDDDDDRDPLDTLPSSRPGSEGRAHSVRFAPGPIEPMAPLAEVDERNHRMGTPNQHYGHHLQPHYQSPHPQTLPMNMHPSLPQPQPNGFHPPYNHMPIEPRYSDQMVVDPSPRRSGGFNPALLNPAEGFSNHPHPYMSSVPAMAPYAPQPTNGGPFHFPPPAASPDPTDPFMSQPHPQQHHSFQPQNGESFLKMLNATPTPPPHLPQQLPVPQPPVIQIDPALERGPSPLPPVAPAAPSTPVPERVATPMVVERTPTPPLPDFNVSASAVADLRYLLKERTGALTIEQLEQLRATCLGTVWRHRKEWDRDELVAELIKEVNVFVDEVAEYDEE